MSAYRPARAARVGRADREQRRRPPSRRPGIAPGTFPAIRGAYAGHHPADSGEALTHLRQLYTKGAQYLVFPWTAHWWLSTIANSRHHSPSAHELICRAHGTCVIYALRESVAFDAFEGRRSESEHQDDDDTGAESDTDRGRTQRLTLVGPPALSAARRGC